MKCHYEVLEVEQFASEDDIRKSYRKLALKWHPDKNLHNSEEAKEQFQLIQQAYEVLSDPQERSWYDRHRDSILKGGISSDYKDDSLNVYQYFTTTCFKGYGDDEKGFYAVYSEVFNKISAEDSEFEIHADSDFEIPVFGDSKSCYEKVVHPFYSYWQSYSTKKPYSWLDKYNIRDAPNRKVLRLMEKENKKIRDKARKERNEEIRALVAFVRKRDKRVQEYAQYLEKKAAENDKKMQALRKTQIIKRKEEISSYVECDWAKFSNLEGELKLIEESVAAEFDDLESEDNASNSEEESSGIPHCMACNKLFKTDKAFINHENSKKHKENLERLESIMKMEDAKCNRILEESCKEEKLNKNIEETFVDDTAASNDKHEPKPRKKKRGKKLNIIMDNDSESDLDNFIEEIQFVKKSNGESDEEDMSWRTHNAKNKADYKKKQKSRSNITNLRSSTSFAATNISGNKEHKCAACKNNFSSKNELFRHLKSSGHSVLLTDKTDLDSTKSRRRKK
ncbi:dnaJ homolog subfamily C member 21 [Rhodnius prolixus]|uniref:DnaJ homolog subfamily C member 21 n=2 Tax=Rhodnius TaxID=13248 RepID=R4FL09_RHOPR